jgi:pimeloyl-ACP methyl ester carboxylesterase
MKSKKRLRTASGGIILSAFLLLIFYLYLDDEKISLNEQTRSKLGGNFIKLPRGVTHYEIAGPQNGSVVVLVHGFSVPQYVWDPTFDMLSSSGFRVLRYDLYGRGYSDRPEGEYSLELYVKQLSQLLSALNIKDPIHLIGLSYGGPIGTAYTNRFPNAVLTLTLIDPISSPVSGRNIFPMNIPLVGEYIMGVYMAPFMLPKTQLKDFFHPEHYPEWEHVYRDQMQYKGFKRAILSSIRNLVDIDPTAGYQAVGVLDTPVLLIWGKEDQTIPATDIEKVRNSIPDIEFHAIDGAGHLPHYEQPDIVNKILLEFLK